MEGFKKYLLTMLFVFIAASSIFAASINPSKGYKDLEWGTTVNQAKNKGYKLSILNENQAAPLKKNFSEKVDIYFVKATDKVVLNLYFVYYKDKLFCVYEIYEKSFNSLKDLIVYNKVRNLGQKKAIENSKMLVTTTNKKGKNNGQEERYYIFRK